MTQKGYPTIASGVSGLDIALGTKFPGSIIFNQIGFADEIDAADPPVDIWDGFGNNGNDLYNFSIFADVEVVSSSNVADFLDVEIFGMDINRNLITQTASILGQTKVFLTTPLLRIFSIVNADTANFSGDVYAYDDGAITGGIPDDPNTVRAVMLAINQKTLMSMFSAPAGFRTFAYRFFANVGTSSGTGDKIADVLTLFKPFGSSAFRTVLKNTIVSNGLGIINIEFELPVEIPEGEDVIFRVPRVEANNTRCGGGFTYLLIPK